MRNIAVTKASISDSPQLKWGMACVLMLLALLLAGYVLEQLQAKEAQSFKSEAHLQKTTQQSIASETPKQMMHLVDIKLPPAPAVNSLQEANSGKGEVAKSKVLHKQAALQIKPSTHKIEDNHSEKTLASIQSDIAQTSHAAISQIAEQLTPEQIKAVQKGLMNKGMSISLPESQALRERMITFLYQCVGVGLASLSKQASGHNLMPLTPMPQHPSAIVRKISGEISQGERRLQQAYAPNTALVRVYPMDFDKELSVRIANELKQRELNQFTAQYDLLGRRLSVSNITLNGEAINQTWLIFDGYAHPCRL